jgi:hypothetical protein
MGGENMAKVGQRWMQQVRREMERKGTVGALRRQLGVPEGQKIPESWLSRIANAKVGETVSLNGKRVKVTTKLKRRVNLARIFRRYAAARQK